MEMPEAPEANSNKTLKQTVKKAILLVALGFFIVYFITDINYQVGWCQSNTGIGGHTTEATRLFRDLVDKKAEACAGHYNNITYDCRQKDILNCTVDWESYRFPWSR